MTVGESQDMANDRERSMGEPVSESLRSSRYTAIAAIASAISALVLLGTAIILWQQLSSTDLAGRTNNAYTAQKDILELTEGMYGILDKMAVEKGTGVSPDPALPKAIQRRVTRLDGLFAAIAGLAAHKGLDEETWISILERTCPTFDDPKLDYKIDGYSVTSIKDACQAPPQKWRGKP
jgi:hypothetical protein